MQDYYDKQKWIEVYFSAIYFKMPLATKNVKLKLGTLRLEGFNNDVFFLSKLYIQLKTKESSLTSSKYILKFNFKKVLSEFPISNFPIKYDIYKES